MRARHHPITPLGSPQRVFRVDLTKTRIFWKGPKLENKCFLFMNFETQIALRPQPKQVGAMPGSNTWVGLVKFFKQKQLPFIENWIKNKFWSKEGMD